MSSSSSTNRLAPVAPAEYANIARNKAAVLVRVHKMFVDDAQVVAAAKVYREELLPLTDFYANEGVVGGFIL